MCTFLITNNHFPFFNHVIQFSTALPFIATTHVNFTRRTNSYTAARQQSTRVCLIPARGLPIKVTLSSLDLANGQTPTLQIIRLVIFNSCFTGTIGDHPYGLFLGAASVECGIGGHACVQPLNRKWWKEPAFLQFWSNLWGPTNQTMWPGELVTMWLVCD